MVVLSTHEYSYQAHTCHPDIHTHTLGKIDQIWLEIPLFNKKLGWVVHINKDSRTLHFWMYVDTSILIGASVLSQIFLTLKTEESLDVILSLPYGTHPPPSYLNNVWYIHN